MSRFLFLILLPVTLCAQEGRLFRPWWDNPVAEGLSLSEAQRKQIQTTQRDFRNRLVDARATLQKAEGDLDDVFNGDNVDQRRANDAINRLANARSDLTKLLAQVSLQLRQVLTSEQWQELQRRERRPQRLDAKPGPGERRGPPGGGPPPGFDRRRGGPGPGGPPPQGAPGGAPNGPPPNQPSPNQAPPNQPPNVAPVKPAVL